MKEVILDTETTGLEVKEGHRIVEIGCVELDNYVITSKKFHCYLNPERKVSEQAFKVHGYSDEFFDPKKFKDIVDEFLNFIKDKKLVIHNASFDLAHLNNELSLLGREKLMKVQLQIHLRLQRKISDHKLIWMHFVKDIKLIIQKKTYAIIDCELLNKVYINLIDQKEPSLDFQMNEISEIKSEKNNIISYSKKVIKPTKEEAELHKLFLKSRLKKNFFN